MKNITYYNAGAGAGKTYTLTNILADKIKSGDIKPDQVILTTFTEAAAAEFRERAKQELYNRGCFDEALALDQAMIGTVHSVANSFIQKFWYYLGISTDLSVMTEEDAEFYLNQSLSTIPTQEELQFLHQLTDDFNILDPNPPYAQDYDFWKQALKKIVEEAENYSVRSFETSRKYSKEYAQTIFEGKKLTLDDQRLRRTVETMWEKVNEELERKPNVATVQKRHNALSSYRIEVKNPSLGTYLKFPDDYPKNFQDEDYLAMVELKGQIWTSQHTLQHVQKTIDILFDLAERWISQYAQYKKEHHLIDYNDMETLFVELLGKEEVQTEIRSSYKCLFVDEFQDSSPIQVRIFHTLSELVNASYWVGDPKQAIYGFRGADTELTKSVVDMLATNSSCQINTLDTCRRSVPEIISLVNDIFVPAFRGMLTKEQVHLNAHRKTIPDATPLRYWALDGRNKDQRAESLVKKIRKLLAEHTEWQHKDVAVLARKNNQLDKVAELLETANIPFCRDSKSLSDTKMTDLLQACLQLIVDEQDNYARMRIAYYTKPDANAAFLIDEKLLADNQQHEYLADVPLIQQVVALRSILIRQSVASLLETLIVECEFARYAKAVSPAIEDIDANLSAVCSLARTYDDHCVRMALPATIQGFIDYMDNHSIPISQNTDGIQLHTIHGSKGLEWKCVIVIGGEEELTDNEKMASRGIFGVHHFKETEPTAENMFPPVTIHYLPAILGKKQPEDLLDNIKKTSIFDVRKAQTIAEYKRLLYVALTRPRDVLIIASATGGKELKLFEATGFDAATLKSKLTEENDGNNAAPIVSGIIGDAVDLSDKKMMMPQLLRPHSDGRLLRDIAPSKVAPVSCTVSVLEHEDKEERISVRGIANIASEEDRYRIIGDCIHQVFCGIEHLSDAQITSLIRSYGLQEILSAEQMRAAWSRLISILQTRYGQSVATRHECAFRLHKDGQIMTGSIDFLYQLSENEVVLIDYKTCPAGERLITAEDSKLYAGNYSGQFAAYRAALHAAGTEVKASLIYYPISGMLVEIK
ncbi:MAG: UvrD-helicase domain-containing protein [Paludibacteraceae bacterium]